MTTLVSFSRSTPELGTQKNMLHSRRVSERTQWSRSEQRDLVGFVRQPTNQPIQAFIQTVLCDDDMNLKFSAKCQAYARILNDDGRLKQQQKNAKPSEQNKNRFLSIRVNRKFCGFSVFVAEQKPTKAAKQKNIHRKCAEMRAHIEWKEYLKNYLQQAAGAEYQKPTRSHVCFAHWKAGCVHANSLLSARNDDIWVSADSLFLFRRCSVYSWLLKMIIILRRCYVFSVALSLRACVCVGVCLLWLRRTLQHLRCLLFLMLSYKKCIKIIHFSAVFATVVMASTLPCTRIWFCKYTWSINMVVLEF